MQPEKSTKINGILIEQYWWCGKFVVSIDHHSTNETYEEAVNRITARETRDGKD